MQRKNRRLILEFFQVLFWIAFLNSFIEKSFINLNWDAKVRKREVLNTFQMCFKNFFGRQGLIHMYQILAKSKRKFDAFFGDKYFLLSEI